MHPPTATAEVSAHGLLAIDPGKSGGIAYMDSDHTVHALPMPDTARDLYRALEILARGPSICFLEEIPMFPPGVGRSIALELREELGDSRMAEQLAVGWCFKK